MMRSHSRSVSEGDRWHAKALTSQGKARSSGEADSRASCACTSGSTSCRIVMQATSNQQCFVNQHPDVAEAPCWLGWASQAEYCPGQSTELARNCAAMAAILHVRNPLTIVKTCIAVATTIVGQFMSSAAAGGAPVAHPKRCGTAQPSWLLGLGLRPGCAGGTSSGSTAP